MKAPEWILSTPRLILVILTLGLVWFVGTGIVEQVTYKDILLVVFGYFFGSRGSEPTSTVDPATMNTSKDVSITSTTKVSEPVAEIKEDLTPNDPLLHVDDGPTNTEMAG